MLGTADGMSAGDQGTARPQIDVFANADARAMSGNQKTIMPNEAVVTDLQVGGNDPGRAYDLDILSDRCSG